MSAPTRVTPHPTVSLTVREGSLHELTGTTR